MASSADARVPPANVRREFLGGLHTETLLWHLAISIAIRGNGLQTSISIADRLKEEAQEAQVFAPGD